MTQRAWQLVAGALALWPTVLGAQQPTPLFRSDVEVTSVDVGVVDAAGRPITDLGAADFTARIDGQPRRVVSAQWIPLVKDERRAPADPLPEGFTSNENTPPGRLIVLAIDDANIKFGGVTQIQRAATAFIDTLSPPDRVSVVGFGDGSPSIGFVTDLQQAKQVISRFTGQRVSERPMTYSISLGEAIAIDRGDTGTLNRVANRECVQGPRRNQANRDCATQVENEARQLAQRGEQRGLDAIRGLAALLTGLRSIDAPKTVVLLTEGFIVDDGQASAAEIGGMAAAARASLYVLELDGSPDVTDSRGSGSPDDRQTRKAGLDVLAGAARGNVFRVVGAGDAAFGRMRSELSGYYLLGVEPMPAIGTARRIRSVSKCRGTARSSGRAGRC